MCDITSCLSAAGEGSGEGEAPSSAAALSAVTGEAERRLLLSQQSAFLFAESRRGSGLANERGADASPLREPRCIQP